MSKELLQICGLRAYYTTTQGDVRAVNNASLNIKTGESVGLVGESGCGKSTLAWSILQLIPKPGYIAGGKIIFKGRNLLDLTDTEIKSIRGKQISMIFQEPMSYLNPIMKVKDQIAEAFLSTDIEKADVKYKVIEALEAVQLPSPADLMERYPHQLSGGMQQRVLIAMALCSNPALLVADEPSTALDVTVQAQILDIIKELRKDFGLSLLLITHDLGVVAEMCDKVYIMYAGHILEESDVFTIFDRPKHPYTQSLLESALSIDEFKKKLKAIKGEVPNLLELPSGCKFNPRCPYRKAICLEKEPPLFEAGKSTVRCWLYK